ncbi:MAG: cyclic nucleotide-binding domain-containing protein [bacterium]
MTANALHAFFVKVPLFSGLSREELDDIVRAVRPVNIPAGQVIFAEHDAGDSAYVIQAGHVEVSRRIDGKDVVLARLGPSEVIGELALIDGASRSATCRTLEDCTLLRLDKGEFDYLRRNLRPAAYSIIRVIAATIAGRIRATNEQMAELLAPRRRRRGPRRGAPRGPVQAPVRPREGHAMSQSIEAMGRLPLFKDLTPAELQLLSKHLRIRKLAPFQDLFLEGERATGCFVVLGGDVEVFKRLPDGREERLTLLAPGALVGHLSLVDHRPRSATCKSGIGGARLLELGRDEFDLLFNARNTFAFKILDHVVNDLAGRLRETNERLSDARRARTADQRVAAAKAAGSTLFGFQIPDSIHGVDLDAIEVEATTQERATKDRHR